MIAKFSHGSNLYGALTYNQEKVDEGLGKVLATNLVLEPANGTFNASACMQDFERFMPSHIRTNKPVQSFQHLCQVPAQAASSEQTCREKTSN